jgi:hypothetical protein
MTMDFRITGIEEGIASLDRLDVRVVPTVAGSLYRSGEHVMTQSKEQYVPVDTGTLRSSGTVQIETTETVVQVHLGFGGPADDYALAVHETNKNYQGGRSWKYLEIPLNQELPEINRSLQDDLRAMAT